MSNDFSSLRAPQHRQRRADGERTRQAILRTAASLATIDGLEGLSIGNLASIVMLFGTPLILRVCKLDEIFHHLFHSNRE